MFGRKKNIEPVEPEKLEKPKRPVTETIEPEQEFVHKGQVPKYVPEQRYQPMPEPQRPINPEFAELNKAIQLWSPELAGLNEYERDIIKITLLAQILKRLNEMQE